MYVPSHVRCVAIYVNACPVLEPVPNGPGILQDAVLNVHLAFLIAGEGGVEPREVPICEHGRQFIAIKEISGSTAFPEEEPVTALVAQCAALVQQGAKRRNG